MNRPTKAFIYKAALIAIVAAFTVILSAPSALADVSLSGLSGKTNTPNSNLNLRSCASTTCSILKKIPHGTILSLTATSGDWFKTSYSSKTGWVHSKYIVLRGTAATTIRRGNTSRKMVAYTFDAGSDVGYSSQILNYLKNNNIKASFGLTGKWSGDNSAIVKRISSEGHTMINHTWSHPSFTGFSTNSSPLSPARRTEQLVRANKTIYGLTGKTTKPYFRPPYGDYNSGVLRDVGANNYSKNVMWTLDSLGWKGLTSSQICTRVVSSMDNDAYKGRGYILLFHVGSASQDANALSCITTKLKNRGFTFGTISQVTAP